MNSVEGTPWRPTRLDDMLDEPFTELERRRNEIALERLDRLEATLVELERDLDEMLEQPACR